MGEPSGNDQDTKRWTAEDFRSAMMTDAGEKKSLVASNPQAFLDALHKELGDTPKFAAAQRRYDAIMQSVAHQEQEMKLGKIDMFVGTEKDTTAATQTKEGTNYLLIN